MIAIEKLLLLKSVSFFKEMPDDLLLHVASSLLHEQIITPGEKILQTESRNSMMCVIASGTVRVHDEQDHTIKELGPRETFGELSAQTTQSPVSHISAVTECLLLTIRNDALYDLMGLDSEL